LFDACFLVLSLVFFWVLCLFRAFAGVLCFVLFVDVAICSSVPGILVLLRCEELMMVTFRLLGFLFFNFFFLKLVFCRGIGNRSSDAVVCAGGFGRRDCGAFASGPN
jgi:hypothetical protein